MPDYEELYWKLLKSATEAISILNKVSQETVDIYVKSMKKEKD